MNQIQGNFHYDHTQQLRGLPLLAPTTILLNFLKRIPKAKLPLSFLRVLLIDSTNIKVLLKNL